MVVSAPAKVNLTLEVLAKRPDGFHDISSVMQTIDLSDTLTFVSADEVSLDCDASELETPDNLVVKAARLLKNELDVGAGVRICLEKRIPMSAGLGGGSSDAATTLKALNVLWGLGLDIDGLLPLASRLGSDVPFFLRGGTALVQGRGEILTPLPPSGEQWLVLAVPHQALANKTAVLYAVLKPSDYSDGSRTASTTEVIRRGGSIGPSLTYNVFEAVAFGIFPGLGDCRDMLLQMGLESVSLSGTGPALYAFVEGRNEGENVVSECTRRGVTCYLTRTLGPEDDLRFRDQQVQSRHPAKGDGT